MVLTALSVALGLIVGVQSGFAAAAEPGAGRGLAGLALEDQNGEPYRAPAANPPVTLVGIWATWCPSCRSELPQLIELGDEFSAAGVQLLLVSVDRRPKRGARYLADLDYNGAAAYDPGAESVRRHGITGIPTVLVIDHDGRERHRVVGSGADALARLKASVHALLEQKEGA
jgi:thiol-disulfide isomerase/thioredoxin